MYDLGFDLKPIENLVISGQLDYKRYEYKSKSYSAEYPEVVHFETGKEIPGTGNSSPNSMSMYWISNSKRPGTGIEKTVDLHSYGGCPGI